MSAIVRTPVQLDELASYGAGPSAKLGSEARRYVTLLKEDPHDQFTAVMNGWDVAGSGHTSTVERLLVVCSPVASGEAQQRPDRTRGSSGHNKGLESCVGAGGMWGQWRTLTSARTA